MKLQPGFLIRKQAMNDSDQDDEPHAYAEGVSYQDYDIVVESLRRDPSQAKLVFGTIETTLIHAAAHDGETETVRLLIALGANIHAQETNGRSPLHWAAANGHIDVVNLLLANGADVNLRDHGGWTPLMFGRISHPDRREEIASVLLEHGAIDEPYPENSD